MASYLECFEGEPDVTILVQIDVVEDQLHGLVLKTVTQQLKVKMKTIAVKRYEKEIQYQFQWSSFFLPILV